MPGSIAAPTALTPYGARQRSRTRYPGTLGNVSQRTRSFPLTRGLVQIEPGSVVRALVLTWSRILADLTAPIRGAGVEVLNDRVLELCEYRLLYAVEALRLGPARQQAHQRGGSPE